MHYSCVVFIFLKKDWSKYAFSSYSFKKLDFDFSVFQVFILLRFEFDVISIDFL